MRRAVLLGAAAGVFVFASAAACVPAGDAPTGTVVTDAAAVEPTLTPPSRVAAPAPSPNGRAAAVGPTEPPLVYYRTCAEAEDAGATPLRRGEPGYRRALDRDRDGVACEVK